MWLALWIGMMLIAPYALLKAYEIYKVKRDRNWDNKDVEIIDNWKYPSNFY